MKTGIRSYSVGGLSIAERVSGTGGGLWWLSPDPVGTVGLQISASSGVVTRRWMDLFGVPRGGASSWSSNFGYLNAPRSATGLTQLGARAYDPVLGKFISPDPLLDLTDPRQLNGYSYSLNSPVSYSDASGLIPLGATDRGDATYRKPAQNHSAGKSTTSTSGKSGSGGGKKAGPPAAGGSAGSGTPSAAQPEQWWNPFSWTSDTWVAIGAGALMTVAGVAIGVCVVATAGICAAVGVGTGALALGAVGAGTNLAAYQLTSGEKTAEGALVAFGIGGALGIGGMVLPAAAGGAITKGATMRAGGTAANSSAGSSASASTAHRPTQVLRVGDLKLPAVPKGAAGTPTQTGKGMEYVVPRGTPEISENVASVRIMEPVTTGRYSYPNGYAVYMNSSGQTVNPLTGQTVARTDPYAHIPL